MPSLEYLRSDLPDEIDPRSDFASTASFARYVCNPRIRSGDDDIDHPNRQDLRQEVVLQVIEARVGENLPIDLSCVELVEQSPEIARAAWLKARAQHYRSRRRLLRSAVAAGLSEDDQEDRPYRASLGYVHVGEVVRRIVRERRPGVHPQVLRRAVITMIETDELDPMDRRGLARVRARLRRLRRETGLPLDPSLL